MIAHWMLYCAAVGVLLCAGAAAAERALRAFGRPVRWAWAAAIVLTLAIPAAARWLPRAVPAALPAPAVTADAAAPSAVPAITPATEAPRGMSIDIGALDGPLSLLWMAATAAAVLALAAAGAVLERRRRRWRAGEVDGVPVLLSPRTGPAVVGLFRSRIVLPEWVVRDAEPRVRALLLEHEREHLRAGDPRLLALGLAAAALMPWNPAAWWQLRRLRLAVEMDCDARVLARRGDVRTYGALLLEVGRRASSDRMITAAAFSEPASFLERRIRMMTSPRTRRPLLRAAAFGGMAALLVAAACRAPGPARPAPADDTAVAPVPSEHAPREDVQRLYPQSAQGTASPATVAGSAQGTIAPAATAVGTGQGVVAPATAVAGSARAAVAPGATAVGTGQATGTTTVTVAGSARAAVASEATAVGTGQGVVAPATAVAGSARAAVAPGATAVGSGQGVIAPATAVAGSTQAAVAPEATAVGSGEGVVAPATAVAGSTQPAVAPGATAVGTGQGVVAPATTVRGSARGAVAPAATAVGTGQGVVAPAATAGGSARPAAAPATTTPRGTGGAPAVNPGTPRPEKRP